MPLYPQATQPAQFPWPQSSQWPAAPMGIGATSGYPAYYQPPAQPMPAFQQAQQRTTGIFGRFVGSASEITPSEIPMDGSYSIFPTNDLSKIYVKSWNTDGTITTLEFSPDGKSDKHAVQEKDDRIEAILEKLSKLEDQLG